MNISLGGKNALVCGSTQGIGKAAAIELALLGASVTLVARNEARLMEVLHELPRSSEQQHTHRVADFNFVDQLRDVAADVVKDRIIHILVNNTGGPAAGPAIEAQTDDFVKAFSNHLLCNHILVQAVTPGMKKAGYGRIINVISTSVKIPIRGLGVSNTIRGAVANWSKTLSVELAPFGITVNNVLPGSTMTGRIDALIKSISEKTGKSEEKVREGMIAEIPAGRMAEAGEVAAAIAFLASPAAAYINGTNLPVDGGRTGSL